MASSRRDRHRWRRVGAVGVLAALLAVVFVDTGGGSEALGASPPDEFEEFFEESPFGVDEIEVETEGGSIEAIPETGVISDDRSPLSAVPPGCPPPELAAVVFEGEVIDTDDRTARFTVAQVRAGDADDFVDDGLIEVRYGLEVQYLETGGTYLVGAQLEPLLGLLYSRVTEPAPLFGGDDVIGLAEIDLDCPEFIDPVSTLQPDGAVVATSVVQPLFEHRGQVLAAAILPFAVVFAVLFLLAAFATSLKGMLTGLRTRSGR